MNLFIDIETISEALIVELPSDNYRKKFKKNVSRGIDDGFNSIGSIDQKLKAEEIERQEYLNGGALYPEFGMICCICIGFIHNNTLRIRKMFAKNHEEEHKMLIEFYEIIKKQTQPNFIGHNIKNFDIPFLFRRSLAHGIKIPVSIDTRGKKPWEVQHIDTMELWGYGAFNNRVSLDDICYCLGLPSSKEETNGSMVGKMFKECKFKEISEYCAKDVEATARVFLAITNSIESFTNVETLE